MSNIRSTKDEPQYCILNKDGKSEALLTGATKKMAVEFYQKYYPGQKVYRRTGNLFQGFQYEEVQ